LGGAKALGNAVYRLRLMQESLDDAEAASATHFNLGCLYGLIRKFFIIKTTGATAAIFSS
jgi:hypothetical protein